MLGREFLAVITRVDTVEEARDVLRRTRSRELLRIALAHLTDVASAAEVAHALTDLAEAVLEAGLLVAYHVVARERKVVGEEAEPLDGVDEVDETTAQELRERRSDPARALGVELAIIAQGSFGAREMGYSSDADVQFIAVDRGAAATPSRSRTPSPPVRRSRPCRPPMKVSACAPRGCRPAHPHRESGSTTSRDAETWEKQALLRARWSSLRGPRRWLTEEWTATYPEGGWRSRTVGRSAMKARVESSVCPATPTPPAISSSDAAG